MCHASTTYTLPLPQQARFGAALAESLYWSPQSIADSCRHLTEAEWSKQDDSFPEILDEMNYNCGDSATSKETDPYALQSNLLYNLLEPAVVCHL